MKKEYKYKVIKIKDLKTDREENIYLEAFSSGLIIGIIGATILTVIYLI